MPKKLISVGQLIDHSWEHFRKHFIELMSVAAWMLLPTIVGIIALTLYPSATTILSERDLTSVENIGSILWIINSFIIAPIVGLWVFISLARLIFNQQSETPTNLRTLSKTSWNYFWPSVWVGILVFLIVATSLLFLAPGFIFYAIGVAKSIQWLAGLGMFLVFLGIIVSIFYSIRWIIRYALAAYALIFENKKGPQALRHSRALIEGQFWPVLVRLIIPSMVFILIALAAESLLLFFAELGIEAVVGLNIDVRIRLISIISALISSITTILINPIVLVANIFLYKNLTEKK